MELARESAIEQAVGMRSWLRQSVLAVHRIGSSWGWQASGVALITTLAAAVPALGQSTATLQEALQLAVCLNDWDSAIARASELEQVPGMPIKTRAELIQLGRQMQGFRQNQTVVSNISGCEPVLAGFGIPGYTGRPLAIERALANAGLAAPIIVPDRVIRQEEALWQAGLGVTTDTSLAPLAEAQRINTRTGSGISTGSVSRFVDVYAFLGAASDQANLTLAVTQQQPGLLYTDDSALLFVFDANGKLLAAASTTAANPPQLEAVTLPTTGLYYAAVTTPQHQPVLDSNGVITGWQGIGTSALAYTLTVSAVTPSPAIGLR